ncbi:GNAT family N-acetyltransferase [Bifidobacterium oedipodis]|uniref:Acetyltransferase n=1 Tax=Bifidobacterium oedipodis TaxID=2675322 RepID=A0A7Y0EQL9_9BIFI|nr:GNAT family protein [Bifidobacterium sp. DSM 109957]NMM94625.1 acetyltransferase [Bifidobacterium sp. DSM 109957]
MATIPSVSVFQSIKEAISPSSRNAIRPPRLSHPALPIVLRPLTLDDADEWNDVRWRNNDWLAPWESGDPAHGGPISYNQWVQRQRRNEQRGTDVVFAIEYQMHIVGQISLGAICYGAMRTGIIGYWVDQQYIGRGFAPMAVCLLADWALGDPFGPALHRLEIAILPENTRSLAVARKVGAHHEGLRERYMYVNGRWRDHVTFALLAEDLREGFCARLAASRAESGVAQRLRPDTPEA